MTVVTCPLQKNGVTKRVTIELPTPTEDPVPEEHCQQAEQVGGVCTHTYMHHVHMYVVVLCDPKAAAMCVIHVASIRSCFC